MEHFGRHGEGFSVGSAGALAAMGEDAVGRHVTFSTGRHGRIDGTLQAVSAMAEVVELTIGAMTIALNPRHPVTVWDELRARDGVFAHVERIREALQDAPGGVGARCLDRLALIESELRRLYTLQGG